MNTLKTLMFGVAFLATSTAANATVCDLAGSKAPATLATVGLKNDSTPAQIVSALKSLDGYTAKDCPASELMAVLMASNPSWNLNTVVTTNYGFSMPLGGVIPPKQVVEDPKPAATAVALTQPTSAAKVEETPELKQAKAKLVAAERKRVVVQKAVGSLPESLRNKEENRKLLEAANQAVVAARADLEAKLALKADTTYVDAENAKQDAAIAAADAKAEAAGKAAADALAQKNGWTAWDWAVAIAAALAFIGAIIAGLTAWFRKPDVTGVVKAALETDGLSHTTLAARLGEMEAKVETLSTDVADGAKDRKQIELPADLEEILSTLSDGEVVEVSVGIEGKRGLLGFTCVGDGQVKTSDIDRQTQAMNIAGIAKTINRAIGAGRVKLRPVATAAAA